MDKFKMYISFALMPLSKSELSVIDEDHQIRPYVYFKIKNKLFGFPCTSKFYNNKNRYNNNIELFHFYEDKSLARLDKIYQIPKKNIMDTEYNLPFEISNSILKKMKVSGKYNHYPDFIMKHINNYNGYLSLNDIVVDEYDNRYLIKDITPDKIYAYRVLSYPNNGLYQICYDGQNRFIDPNIVEINSESLKYENNYQFIDCILNDFSPVLGEFNQTINELISGSAFIIDDIRYIVLKNEIDYLLLACGPSDEMYSNYNIIKYYKKEDVKIKVDSIITSERVDKLLEKNSYMQL